MNLLSGYPFWLVKNGLPFSYEALEDSIKTDVVIMGGGISGALMGYYLAEAGVECVIVDGRTIGLGSTCASTSLLQYEIDVSLFDLKDKIGMEDAVRAYKLCEQSIKKLHNICQKIQFSDFEFKKSLYYAAAENHISKLKQEFIIRKNNGFDVEYLERGDLKSTYGFYAPGAILSGIAAQTDAYKLTHALHQYSKKKGVKIYDRTEVTDIKHLEKSVCLQIKNGNTIQAKKLVYATGYESVKYVDKKIVKLYSTFATITEQQNIKANFWKDDALIWNTADPYLYLRTTGDKRVIIGGRDEKYSASDHKEEVIKKKSTLLYEDFNKLFPHVKVTPEFSWMGIFGKTKDGLPYIGPYKKLPNSFFALGFGGNGITFSLTAAEIITDILKGNKNKDAILFTFER